MNKYKISSLFLILSMALFSQATKFYFPRQENSAALSERNEIARINLKNAYDAYNEGDLEKTKYYLDNTQRHGWVNASFYYLLGKWCYDKKNFISAKRYWKRGFKKKGCWECNELIKKMDAGDKL